MSSNITPPWPPGPYQTDLFGEYNGVDRWSSTYTKPKTEDVSYLGKASQIADCIYSRWVTIMNQKNVTNAPQWPKDFDGLDEKVKDSLIEAVEALVVFPLISLENQFKRERQEQETQTQPGSFACYCCSAQLVSAPGKACSKCIPKRSGWGGIGD